MIKQKVAIQGELVFGINPLVELLKAGKRRLVALYTTKTPPKGWSRIEALLPKKPLNIQYVDHARLHQLAGTTEHQGIVALAQPFVFAKAMFSPEKAKQLILLDGIQDPRNLGAILRSAYCAGFDGAILTQKGSAPLSAIALKASAGLAEHLPIYESSSAQSAALALKAAGYTMYMATFDGKSPNDIAVDLPLCIVVGSEGIGITKGILSMGTHITLPQRSADISYNVSVASGILLFIVGTRSGRIS